MLPSLASASGALRPCTEAPNHMEHNDLWSLLQRELPPPIWLRTWHGAAYAVHGEGGGAALRGAALHARYAARRYAAYLRPPALPYALPARATRYPPALRATHPWWPYFAAVRECTWGAEYGTITQGKVHKLDVATTGRGRLLGYFKMYGIFLWQKQIKLPGAFVFYVLYIFMRKYHCILKLPSALFYVLYIFMRKYHCILVASRAPRYNFEVSFILVSQKV